jgi:benzoylformate decarboxylase
MSSEKPSPVPELRIASARFEDTDVPVNLTNQQMGWGSDAAAEMLRRLDLRYIALVPGSSYRGLHDSLVNYLGNRDPKIILCLHEETAVAIAHGYAKVTDFPMAVAVHANVGLMHAAMAIYNAWCARRPMLILGSNGPDDADIRRPWIDWIHTSKDQAAIIRPYIKWDDEPRSPAALLESLLRAHQIAWTPPYGPTYVCIDVAVQEQAVSDATGLSFPDPTRFLPGANPAPDPESVKTAARLLANAKKPLILMGRVSRRKDDWDARVALAEALGAVVLTDIKTCAAFPTEHPLHPFGPRVRPSPEVAAVMKEADVILALDWVDLKGQFHLAFGHNAPVEATVINCSLDRYVHNGWSMDHQGLPPVDLPILSTPDALVRPLLEAIYANRGNRDAVTPKFRPRQAPNLPKPSDGVMGLRDLALVIRDFAIGRDVTIANYALGWPADMVSFSHPLDYVGFDAGGGVGSGPGNSIGTALALKGSGRLVLSVIGDGDFLMAVSAFWTAVHMQIPLLVVIANNRAYYNDVGHQERMAVVRGRPVENKYIGQEMVKPEIDLIAMARAQGVATGNPVETVAELRAELAHGETVVRSGGVYLIDARITRGYADEAAIAARIDVRRDAAAARS